MDMPSCNILLLLIALLLRITSPTILYVRVIPDNHYSATNSSYHTLQYYLNHTLTSHTQLHFLQGHHYLYDNLIIHNVTNISLTGVGNVIIDCKGFPSGIIVSNVTQFTMEYLSLLHCNYSNIPGSRYANIYTRDDGKVMDTAAAAAVCLDSCRSVIIVNLSITVNIGVDGLLVTNTEHNNQIINVTVQVNCTHLNTRCSSNGIALHHFDNGSTDDTSILIENYVHKGKGNCANTISHPQCALKVLLTQSLYSVNIYVVNTTFNGLRNITVLYYYGELSGVDTWSRLTFLHCQIYRNTNNLIPLLHVTVHNAMLFDSKDNNSDCKHSNVITLVHCKLFDNFNTVSLLQIVPINTILINVHIQMLSCKFSNNNARFMIEVRSRVNIFRQLSHQISLNNTTIDHNEHNRGISLLSVNGVVNILNNVVISYNNYFNSALIYLHLSVLNIYGSCKIYLEIM